MTGHLRGDARKRQTDAHQIHFDPAVRDLIERERRAAAVEALRKAADDWETNVADPTPRTGSHADGWLRNRADRIERGDA